MNVIKNEASDTPHYSPLGNTDQSMVENLPADEVVQSKRKNSSTDVAYKTVVEHLPSDADQSGGQGSSKQISKLEASNIRVVAATDSPDQLAGVKSRQPAQLVD